MLGTSCPTDLSGYAQAIAILLTGCAAVGAALHVGSKQAAILAGQNALKEHEIKVSLLKERAAAVAKAKHFVRDYRDGMAPLSQKELETFYDDIDENRLIFPDEIAEYFEKCLVVVHTSYNNFFRAAGLKGEGRENDAAVQMQCAIKYQTEEVVPALSGLLDQMIAHARVDL